MFLISPAILISLGVGLAILIPLILLFPKLQRWGQAVIDSDAIEKFRLERETLEAKFFELASTQGKPKGLRWLECDWQSDVRFARDQQTNLLTAFVAVNIRFEAIEGGDMEDVEAVGLIRDATAVFHYQGNRWGTGGRALFNMNPEDAMLRLATQYDTVDEES